MVAIFMIVIAGAVLMLLYFFSIEVSLTAPCVISDNNLNNNLNTNSVLSGHRRLVQLMTNKLPDDEGGGDFIITPEIRSSKAFVDLTKAFKNLGGSAAAKILRKRLSEKHPEDASQILAAYNAVYG